MATSTSLEILARTEQTVRYRYGPTKDRMDQELIIELATGTTTGTDDRAPWVGGWLRNRHRTTGEWPERASIAT